MANRKRKQPTPGFSSTAATKCTKKQWQGAKASSSDVKKTNPRRTKWLSGKGNARRVYLNHQLYKSKTNVSNKVKHLKKKYKIGESIQGDDFEFLLDFFHLHPQADRTFGGGVDVQDIKVQTNGLYNDDTQREFWIVTSGGKIRMSCKDCIHGESKSNKKIFDNACRFAILPQTSKFKKDAFKNGPVMCKVCNKVFPTMDDDDCEVDHDCPKFNDLVKNYVTSYSIDMNTIEYDKFDGRRRNFRDKQFERKFQVYHKQFAKQMRILCKTCNLKNK